MNDRRPINHKGQVSVEYLMTYAWAFLVLLLMVGVMYYMDLFNMEKYSAQYCIFDANMYCSDYSVQTYGNNTFDVYIALQNNMDDDIFINKVKLFDDNNNEIICDSTAIYCPLFEIESFSYSNPSNTQMMRDTNKSWIPTRQCKVTVKDCPGRTAGNYKQKLNLNITFRGENGYINHTTLGTIYANIERLTGSSTPTIGACDIANFDSHHKLLIQDSLGNNLLMLDGNGMMLITGMVFESFDAGYDSNDFKIEIDGDIIAWVSNPEGNLYLNGNLEEMSAEEPKNGVKEFIIENSAGGALAFFDESGNLYLKN